MMMLSIVWRYMAKYWPIILAVVILGYCLFKYNSATSARDEAINELEAFKQAIAIKVREQEIENAVKLSIAKKEVEQAEQIHSKQIEVIKNAYDKRNKTDVNTIANLRNELRKKVRSDTFTIAKIDPNSERTAEEWRNSHTALAGQYENLVDACRLTTSDYNLLRNWADSACSQMGCE